MSLNLKELKGRLAGLEKRKTVKLRSSLRPGFGGERLSGDGMEEPPPMGGVESHLPLLLRGKWKFEPPPHQSLVVVV